LNGDAEIVGSLKIDPELGCVTEISRQTQRGIRIEGASTIDDLAQSIYWNFQFARQATHSKTQRLHEVFFENLSWVYWLHSAIFLGHDRLLVIINNLNVKRITIAPNETDAILIVDADAVLALPIAFQRLKAIPRKDC
jgi:hypothetical protein